MPQAGAMESGRALGPVPVSFPGPILYFCLSFCFLAYMPIPCLYLMWFEIPKSKDVRLKNTSGKVCGIRVTGGTFTTQEVLNELDSLVPRNKQWDIESMDNGVYKVILPTKVDMARLRKVKYLKIDSERVRTLRNGPPSRSTTGVSMLFG
jgi:hypothetical protein